MAYVSNYLTQAIAATTAVTLPPHEVDDSIVVAVSGDGGGTLSFTWGGNSTGGAQVGTTQVSTTLLCAAVSTAKATGDAATCTVTMGTADSMWVHMFILKDCDTTTWLDASNATVAAAALEITTASVTKQPTVLESGKKLQIQSTVAPCTGAGVVTVYIMCERLSAGSTLVAA